ncbi:sarcosine oxidase subunit alpha family protein [Sphingosinicella sp.]|uniref:sarcosine oxidase subunit alpha family protein n=1 Tax=Sphingosinicella sp. TaxID=1917971 RepID=UPI0035AF6BF3
MNRGRIADAALVDTRRTLRFTFDGRTYTGYAGDTLASALLANGVRLIGRSFKYHRPRGIVTAGSAEPNALVTIDRGDGRITPNLRATMVELYDGLAARSQNAFPSLRFDLGAIADRLSPILAAGFYYKTFLWPRSFWKRVYEPLIRRAAGLGTAPRDADADRYAVRYAHCDVLVVGAGPAGLAAARAASESGKRVILCDENAALGVSLLDDPRTEIDGVPAAQWRREALECLRIDNRVLLLPRTTAFGLFTDRMAGLSERITDHLSQPPDHLPRERLWQVRAGRIVLATGAIEQPLVFPNNDRPGIMLAGAARAYARRWGILPGKRAVLVTGSDSGWHDALDLHAAGLPFTLIADVRGDVDPALRAAAEAQQIPVRIGADIGSAIGGQRLRGILIDGTRTECDLLLTSSGWLPAVHLHAQIGGRLSFDVGRGIFVPDMLSHEIRCVGSCNGTFTLRDVVAEARSTISETCTAGHPRTGGGLSLPTAGTRPARKAFIDLQSDVTTDDIGLAVREGFHSMEHIKRYTTTGMGVDQGKGSNVNALAIAAQLLDKPIPEVGTTTFRMPFTPVSFGALAGPARGPLFEPQRRTAIDAWAAKAGAVFEPVGNWRRARHFPRPGETMHSAVARECRTVRTAVGLFDASTLGKIEVVGPGAATFMERVYTNPWRKLPPGRCRYGLVLREDGFIFDDGVVARLADDRFHVTTTTGGAANVLAHFEDYLQTEWPDLDVWLTSTTEQWAVIAVQGPKARDVLAPLVEGIDLDNAAMPHMSVADGRICSIPMRLFRVSFTGELGFEVNVPSSQALEVWKALWLRAQAVGGCVYGTEAMHVLRAEMGFIIIGQETDGTVTPDDAGLGWAIGKTKADFVGKRSLQRPDICVPDRRQLVGLFTDDPKLVLTEGAQIVDEAFPRPRTHALGHVTSAYWSDTLQRSIALALVERGRSRTGNRLFASGESGFHPVTVTALPFYTPDSVNEG